MIEPLVSIIVVNYNGRKYLEECFTSLKNQSYPNFEVLFVDNHSTDGSVEYVMENYARFVRIILNKENFGFAKGNNIGICASQGNYIATLNNDTRVDPNWLKELVRAAEVDSKIGMCASKIYLMQNKKIIDSVGIGIYPDGTSKQRGWLEKDIGQYAKQEEILLPSACAALYRKKMLDEIGLFDEDFFAYCEDTDLGLRGQLAGWKCVFVPNAIVKHYYSRTAGKFSDFKAYLVERNHCLVALKNFPLCILLISPFYTCLRLIVQIYSALRLSNKSIRKGRLSVIIIKAYLFVLFNLLKTLKKRKNIFRGISDFQVCFWFIKYRLRFRDLVLKE